MVYGTAGKMVAPTGGLVIGTPIRRTVFLALMILPRSDRWALMFYSVS